MTDDSLAERNALQTCFPKSTLLLCTFHVLQAVWRWLWDSKHNINVEHRKYLINLLRKILYSSNEHECVKAMDTLISDNISKKYINYIRYIEKLWQRRTEWCLCYRSKLSIRGNNTNNIVESSIRIFKDIVLERCKAFNMCALVDFIASVFERYHKTRLLKFANKRVTKTELSYLKFIRASKNLIVTQKDSNQFSVQSLTDDNVLYTVFQI